ncbi:MAG TPA: nitrophenyl compound nitroreductase subunit ArsF family protein, partial [Prolixibacteraceae bacterium]|nr:nitrophenyl compound nitroreductase subunit ArsF family protein [Prolixibacteraceae bacterium]
DISNVEVIYFHATRRCATCNAVEEVTKEVLNDVYENKIKFTSIDREQDKKNSLLKKHKVNGQTLLIIKGDKVVNLTNDAFMYARTNPEKLKEKLKETINSI